MTDQFLMRSRCKRTAQLQSDSKLQSFLELVQCCGLPVGPGVKLCIQVFSRNRLIKMLSTASRNLRRC